MQYFTWFLYSVYYIFQIYSEIAYIVCFNYRVVQHLMSTIQFICPSAVDSIIFKSVPIVNPGEILSYVDYTRYTNAFNAVHLQNRIATFYITFSSNFNYSSVIPQRKATALRMSRRERKAFILSFPLPTQTEQRFSNLS